jgi:hypothetical protein
LTPPDTEPMPSPLMGGGDRAMVSSSVPQRRIHVGYRGSQSPRQSEVRVPSPSPLQPSVPHIRAASGQRDPSPSSIHWVEVKSPRPHDRTGLSATSPAVKTGIPCLPPRSALRAVGGSRTGHRILAAGPAPPATVLRFQALGQKSQRFVEIATIDDRLLRNTRHEIERRRPGSGCRFRTAHDQSGSRELVAAAATLRPQGR